MSPRLLPPWRPMSEFDPSRPAVLHDAVNDIEIEWSGDADEWRRVTLQHTENVISFDGYLIDRWREPVKH